MSTMNEMDELSGWALTAESQPELFPEVAEDATRTPETVGVGRQPRRQLQDLSDDERRQMVAQHRAGVGFRAIAEELNMSFRGVREALQVLDPDGDDQPGAVPLPEVETIVGDQYHGDGADDLPVSAVGERPEPVATTPEELPVGPEREAFTHSESSAKTGEDVPQLTPVTVAEMFDSRASLRSIRDNARNAGEAPFAVLVAVIIRLLACTPPSLTLPGFGARSAPGSLNLYGAVAAPSGGGKGEVMALAENCLIVRDTHGKVVDLETFSIGSGEGLVAVFDMPEDPEELPVTRAMAEVDEITELTALSGRTGATLQPKLLSMWSGKSVGNRNRGKGTSQQVEAGRYRLTVMAGVQPGNADSLLNPEASTSGLPQRFLWASMTDPGYDMSTPAADPVTVEVPAGDDRARSVEVCPEVWDALRADKARKRAGNYPHPWDSHAIQCREIIGVALSLLDGRNGDVDAEDWRLSGLLWRHNRDTRLDCLRGSHARAAAAAADRERVREDARGQLGDDRMSRAREVIEWALSDGNGRFHRSEVRNGKVRRYRAEFDDVLTEMAEARQVVVSRDKETGAEWVIDLRQDTA